MGKYTALRRALSHAATPVLLAGLAAGCADGMSGEPAPVYMKNGPDAADAMSATPQRETRTIVVQRGQSLSRLAVAYHVPQRTIIVANHLSPPYKIKIGQKLVIPGAAEPPAQLAAARPTPPQPTAVPRPAHAAALPVAAQPAQPGVIPLDGPAAPPAPKTIVFPDPPTAAAPASTREARPTAAPAQATPAAAELSTMLPPEPSAADEARAEDPRSQNAGPAALRGGRYPWPVHGGHILAGYGMTAGGTHNDGINIAAPRGTPIAAIDSGIVAYAGNELRGYGNLILIKHSNGWISAYAHCEELLVKRGDPVYRGQTIAKVGDTGGVSEPQLHFELRRGKRPVDPREFLVPAPSADAATASAG